jgi:anti-anti-sigma regulatory factor
LQTRIDRQAVLVVRHSGELDESASRHLVERVRERTTRDTTLIVVSLSGATEVHWNALHRLARALRSWRACRKVVLKGARPSLRALLASADGML